MCPSILYEHESSFLYHVASWLTPSTHLLDKGNNEQINAVPSPVIVTPPVENIFSVALGLYNLYVTPGCSSGS